MQLPLSPQAAVSAVGTFTAAADGLVALNDHLATRSAVAGHALTSSDAEVYVTVIAALNASSETLPHARRWASFVCARGAAAEAGVETARELTHASAPVFERPAPGEKKASASTRMRMGAGSSGRQMSRTQSVSYTHLTLPTKA